MCQVEQNFYVNPNERQFYNKKLVTMVVFGEKSYMQRCKLWRDGELWTLKSWLICNKLAFKQPVFLVIYYKSVFMLIYLMRASATLSNGCKFVMNWWKAFQVKSFIEKRNLTWAKIKSFYLYFIAGSQYKQCLVFYILK